MTRAVAEGPAEDGFGFDPLPSTPALGLILGLTAGLVLAWSVPILAVVLVWPWLFAVPGWVLVRRVAPDLPRPGSSASASSRARTCRPTSSSSSAGSMGSGGSRSWSRSWCSCSRPPADPDPPPVARPLVVPGRRRYPVRVRRGLREDDDGFGRVAVLVAVLAARAGDRAADPAPPPVARPLVVPGHRATSRPRCGGRCARTRRPGSSRASSACVVLSILGSNGWRETPDGMVSGGWNWSDLLVHVAIGNSIVHGNFPPEVPYFAGEPLTYHWFADFHGAIAATAANVPIIPVFFLSSALMAGGARPRRLVARARAHRAPAAWRRSPRSSCASAAGWAGCASGPTCWPATRTSWG